MLQAIAYDERGDKIGKWVWDDHALSPIELVDLPDASFDIVWGDAILHHLIPELDFVVSIAAVD